MTFQELRSGDLFIFDDTYGNGADVYEYRGSGWYGRPYSGGPWCIDANPRVLLATSEQANCYRQWERKIHAEYSLDPRAARATLTPGVLR